MSYKYAVRFLRKCSRNNREVVGVPLGSNDGGALGGGPAGTLYLEICDYQPGIGSIQKRGIRTEEEA